MIITIDECHALLDLSSGASSEEIKRAYRKKARVLHPDINPSQDAAEQFTRLRTAYEMLTSIEVSDTPSGVGDSAEEHDFFAASDPYNWRSSFFDGQRYYGERNRQERNEIIVPDPHTIIVDGIAVHVTYRTERSGWSSYLLLEADFHIQRREIEKWFSEAGVFSRFVVDLDNDARHGKWYIEQGGETLFVMDYFSRHSFKYEVEKYEKGQAAQTVKRTLTDLFTPLMQECEDLRERGFAIGGISRLFEEIEHDIRTVGEYSFYGRTNDSTAVRQKISKAQNEIKRLQGVRDRSELFVDDLIEGKIFHPATVRNQTAIDTLRVLSIRSGGFIESFTERSLREYYLARVNDQVGDPWSITYDEFLSLDLLINVNDCAPAEIGNDPELELAPLNIDIQARKGLIGYGVEYSTVTVDNVEVLVGIVKIPISVYKKNAAEYGKRSSFPELPHGIRLFIELLDDGKSIGIAGFDDQALAAKCKKYEGGKRRSKIVNPEMEWHHTATMGTEVPSWYVGSKIRWR